MRRLRDIFGKRLPQTSETDLANSLDQDPRWKRFMGDNGPCPCCGKPMQGVFDIGFHAPTTWSHPTSHDNGPGEFRFGEDFLNSDTCLHAGDFFVRCVFPLPIRGCDQSFSFGCWGSLSEESFRRLIQSESGDDDFEGAFSWLSNSFPCFDLGEDEHVACDLIPGKRGQRPSLHAQEGPLFKAQKSGISFDHLLDIYAATGNDMRPHLVD
ncbi:DUF2199 domain-containing protein [Celeribacter neptunius]|uniref:DUF2199 domain-containing protein n=1 Tax=Celeribacter neptunius TaxID=588602 RepID=A0A1I3JE05_9RHOB|nr:DUF2199 domain-containing protein [Celeribacter neptunius]SFI58439.1 hypothetical protein SAMN04487991_0325 [Celeribacter neptunius]